MTKVSRTKRILSLVFALVIVVFTFTTITMSASAKEVEETPQPATVYDNCNVYIRSDVYPIVVHYVVYTPSGSNSLAFEELYNAQEFDVTINSASDFISLDIYEWKNIYFVGTIITSIKCQGYNPSICSVDLNKSFPSWEENRLSVNKFDKASVYFNGYAVEDTSSKTIDVSFLGGYDNGYSDGYEKGVEDGYNTGYDYGYRIAQEGVNAGNNSDATTDTTDVTTDEWQTLLGIGAGLILLALIVLGISKAKKQIK